MAANLKINGDGKRNQLGRPPKYDADIHPQAAQKLCRMGATVRDLAEAFDVALSTIWALQVTHAHFFEAMTAGRDAADARVERALYERSVGYSYPAVRIMTVNGEPVIVDYIEHVPPDVNAARFWLQNRRSDRWKDKATINHNVNAESPLVALAKQLAGTAIRPREE